MSADLDTLVAAFTAALRNVLPDLHANPQRIHRPGDDMREVTGLGPTAIAEQVAAGKLRPPIRLSQRAVGFLASDVLEWQRQRIAERDAAPLPKPKSKKRASKNGGA